MICSFRILLALAVGTEMIDTWRGWLRIKLETCLVGLFVHWRKVSAAQAGHDVEPHAWLIEEETRVGMSF